MQAPIPAPIPSPGRRPGRALPSPLGQMLLEKGIVDAAGLEKAMELKRRTGMKLGQALTELCLLSESGLAEALRWQGRVPCVHLTVRNVDLALARQLPQDASQRLGAVVVNRIGGIVTVALEDPSDPFVLDELQRILGARVFAVYAEPSRIREVHNSIYHGAAPALSVREGPTHRIVLTQRHTAAVAEGAPAPDHEVSKDTPERMRSVLEAAVAAGAAAVHLDPGPGGLVVRMRLGEGLRQRQVIPSEWAPKCMAWLRAEVGRSASEPGRIVEGRAPIELAGRDYLLVVSIAPGAQGESAVVRLLEKGANRAGFGCLSLERADEERLGQLLTRRSGLLVCAGPVGSGVSTTLLALGRELVRADRKLVTLEDPVEALVEGAHQVDAAHFAGRDQASALRCVLRFDPDVLLLGEVLGQRSFEVLEHAASAGVLALLGLRARTPGQVLDSLWALGAERYALSRTLLGVVVHRTVALVCERCGTNATPTEHQSAELARFGLESAGLTAARGKGCESCCGRGFRGHAHLREVHDFAPAAPLSLGWSAGADYDAHLVQRGELTLARRAVALAQAGRVAVDDLLRCLNQV